MVGATAKVGLAAAAAKTCAAGIAKAVAGFGGPLVAGLAGGMLGDGWVPKRVTGLWIPGKDHAVSGPTDIPACVGHHIVHNNSFLGAIGGLIGGLIVGIAVGALVVATGGAALGFSLPLLLPEPEGWRGICRRCRDGHWFPLGL